MISYLLKPFGAYDLQNRIFESPYKYLRLSLQKRGVDLQTYDQGDLRKAEKVLCFNHSRSFYNECKRAGLRREQLVLFLMEPRVVIPSQYTPETWEKYGLIFTFLDNLVDGMHILHMRYPQGQTLLEHVPSWEERQFLMLMNANKYSYVTHELYTLRRKAIAYFENNSDFHLYGHGWNNNGTLNTHAALQAILYGQPHRYFVDLCRGFKHSTAYQGAVTDKYSILQKYRFCLAFENEDQTQGWISEKLFDCLFTGIVPVYLGAKNITDVIPNECFIDFREFPSFEKLEQFLRNMTAQTWLNYQQAGQAFIRSAAFAPWLPQNTFPAVAEKL
jgi:hypothetical protein